MAVAGSFTAKSPHVIIDRFLKACHRRCTTARLLFALSYFEITIVFFYFIARGVFVRGLFCVCFVCFASIVTPVRVSIGRLCRLPFVG